MLNFLGKNYFKEVNINMQGVLFALVPIFAWGAVGLVANILGGDPNQQTLGMTLGAFVVALIVSLFRMPTLTWQIFLIGFIGGLFWVIGQFGQFNSMKYMGVSVASPLSAGSQLVFGVLLGVLLSTNGQNKFNLLSDLLRWLFW